MEIQIDSFEAFIGVIFTFSVITLALSTYGTLYLRRVQGFIQYQRGNDINRILNDLFPYDEVAKAILSAIVLFLLFSFVAFQVVNQNLHWLFLIFFGLIAGLIGLSLIYYFYFYCKYRKEKIFFIDEQENEWYIINIYSKETFVAKKEMHNEKSTYENDMSEITNSKIWDSEINDSIISDSIIMNSKISGTKISVSEDNNCIRKNNKEKFQKYDSKADIKIVSIEDVFYGNPKFK